MAARAHRLRYRVFYFLLDLDALPRLDRSPRWFAYNRRAWFAFHDADHGAGDGTPFRSWLAERLLTAGLGPGPWRFRVLCMPRVLGYVFNPISVVWCHDAAGTLRAVLYEVNNTFGERQAYLVPVNEAGELLHQRCDKTMFVSPFAPLAGHYEFRLRETARRLDLVIDYHLEGVRQLRAAFGGTPRPFHARTLAGLAWRQPCLTLGVVAGIHLEALRLWLKGVPLLRHVARPRENELTLGRET